MSRQLRLLEEADLIWSHTVPGDGRAIMYTINPSRHGAITAWLAGTDVGRPLAADAERPGMASPTPRDS